MQTRKIVGGKTSGAFQLRTSFIDLDLKGDKVLRTGMGKERLGVGFLKRDEQKGWLG
jgi:hypothetical protein